MDSRKRRLGYATRIRVRMPLLATRYAWDCRPFGFGRIVAPCVPGMIEIAPGVELSLADGELRCEAHTVRRSA
jgi:hypothetical protein